MKNFFLKILFIALWFLLPAISFAAISKVTFTTEAQSVKVNSVSGKITIQTQNSSGGAEAIGETADVFLESTSPTGEFSSSADNWENVEDLTMNSNWSNRSFYYKDSVEGNFIITARIRTRTSGEEWNASQNILVSDSASNSNSSAESSSSNSSNNTESSDSSSSSGSSSLTRVSTPGRKLEIYAGEDRVATPGSPIWFQATVKKNTASNSELNFHWSFGDGKVGTGNLVSHAYKYPGEYAVVLSANTGNFISTSRLKVKVANLSISVSDGDSFVEITNNTNSEINLFKWRLENQGRGFIFQPNTIILPKSSIKIEKDLFTLKGGDNSDGICLKDSFGQQIFSVAPPRVFDGKEISRSIVNLQKEAYSLVEKAVTAGLVLEKSPAAKMSQVASPAVASAPTLATSSDPGNVIYEVPKEQGLLSKLTNFVKRVFSR